MAKTFRKCPQCESTDVEPDSTEMTVFSHGNTSSWTCNKCGNHGIFPEIEMSDEEANSENGQGINFNIQLIDILLLFAVLIILLLLTIQLN